MPCVPNSVLNTICNTLFDLIFPTGLPDNYNHPHLYMRKLKMREGELLKKEQKKSTAFETKECKMQYLGAISKNDRMISVCFQSKPFNITVIQVYAPTTEYQRS